MKKIFLLYLIILLFCSCNKTTEKSTNIILQEENELKNFDIIRFKLDYSENNRLIGLDKTNWAFVYEKNIIFEDSGQVIAYLKLNKSNFSKALYLNKKPLYLSPENTDESLIGLFDHWLFIDGGTSPGTHQLKIIDIDKQKIVFYGSWYIGKKIIDRIDDKTFIVYKHNNDKKYIDETNDRYVCTISAFSLNLDTLKLTPLHYSIKVYGQ